MAEKIHRENWKFDKITSKNKPFWLCPSCGTGPLIFGENWFDRKPDSKTGKESNRLYYVNFPEEENFHFTGFVVCANKRCNENIAVVGKSGNQVRYGNGERRIRRFFVPYFFYPPLQIFPISGKCPEELKNQLIRSFSHYFNDRLASANALRTALEYLLNDFKIPTEVVNKKGKTVDLKLDARIGIFGREHSELSPFLFAAKWIGNAGSHVGEIDQDGLLDGFEFFNHCIYELYEKPENLKLLGAKAKEINETRKPIKK